MARVYLDIETTRSNEIYLIGLLSQTTGLVQLHGRNLSKRSLLEAIPVSGHLYTFNGTSFDIPRVLDQLDVDLEERLLNRDLRRLAKERGYTGGLKQIEQNLGYIRPHEPLNVWQQWALWKRWKEQKDNDALGRILSYNEHDLRGMHHIRRHLRV